MKPTNTASYDTQDAAIILTESELEAVPGGISPNAVVDGRTYGRPSDTENSSNNGPAICYGTCYL